MKLLCIGGCADGQYREANGERMVAMVMPERTSAAHYGIGQGWPSQSPSPELSDYRRESVAFTIPASGALERRYFWVEESLSPLAAFDLLLSGYNRPAKASKTSAAA